MRRFEMTVRGPYEAEATIVFAVEDGLSKEEVLAVGQEQANFAGVGEGSGWTIVKVVPVKEVSTKEEM